MGGQHLRRAVAITLKEAAAGLGGERLVGVVTAIPVRVVVLDWIVDQIARDHRIRATAVGQHCLTGLDYRQHVSNIGDRPAGGCITPGQYLAAASRAPRVPADRCRRSSGPRSETMAPICACQRSCRPTPRAAE